MADGFLDDLAADPSWKATSTWACVCKRTRQRRDNLGDGFKCVANVVVDMRMDERIAREQADDYAEAQRRAFLDGFHAAADEAKSLSELQAWLEEERDRSKEKADNGNDLFFARQLAFVEVLKKLREMGVADSSKEDGDLAEVESVEENADGLDVDMEALSKGGDDDKRG